MANIVINVLPDTIYISYNGKPDQQYLNSQVFTVYLTGSLERDFLGQGERLFFSFIFFILSGLTLILVFTR